MGEVILKCITMILVAVATCYVIPFLKDKKLYDSVVIAVQAAEQIYKGSGRGKEKFAYVKDWIKKTFDISDDALKNIIESAVYEINKEKSEGT